MTTKSFMSFNLNCYCWWVFSQFVRTTLKFNPTRFNCCLFHLSYSLIVIIHLHFQHLTFVIIQRFCLSTILLVVLIRFQWFLIMTVLSCLLLIENLFILYCLICLFQLMKFVSINKFLWHSTIIVNNHQYYYTHSNF